MGTEFEDENAKEKLKAMLNRQFGIGDVSFPFPGPMIPHVLFCLDLPSYRPLMNYLPYWGDRSICVCCHPVCSGRDSR